MSSDWIRRALKSANISQAEIARRSGIDRSYVSHQLTGSREMTFDVAKVLAEALKVSEAEILHRAGAIGSDLPPVPVLGRVGDGGRVEWYAQASRHVVSPVRGADSDVAIEDRSGGALDGWVLYLSRLQDVPLDLAGSLVVADLRQGASVVRELSPGGRTGTIDLLGRRLLFPDLKAADVLTARRVAWIRPHG